MKNWAKPLAVIIIFSLGIFVYSNTFFCPFHFDDQVYIVSNFTIRNIHSLFHYWGLYPCRFVTFLSFAVNYHFSGLNVLDYHLFNLAVHLLTACLIWWLVLLTLSTPALKENKITQHANLIALFTALVFVSHPIQTEAVTYIWQRTASMAALFYVASLCLYIKSRLRQGSNASYCYYIGSLLMAMVAMFTKENTVTLPLMILLYEYSFLEAKKNLNWQRVSPFFLTILIIPLTIVFTKAEQFQAIQKFSQGAGGTSPIQYLLTQFRVVSTYIRLIFIPVNQNLDYDYSISKSIFELPVLVSFLFLTAILLFAKRIFLKYRLVSFSIFWFFLTLLPESSILPLKNIIFEHRLYLPMVGYSMFLVGGAYYLLGKNSIKTMVIVLSLIITCNSILTYQRNKIWKDEITLWGDTAQKSPHKARPYNNRGVAYALEGSFTRAIADFTMAIANNPDDAEAYNNRGHAYAQQGNLQYAIHDYSKAIEINSIYIKAYINRGNIYDEKGDLTQAMSDYNKVIELNPDYADAYCNRGSIYYQQGNLIQAILDYSKAIELNSSFTQVYSNRAIAYYYLGDYDEAWEDVHKAEEVGVAVNPDFIRGLKQASGREQ